MRKDYQKGWCSWLQREVYSTKGDLCMVWYGMVFKYLYRPLQQPWANRGAFGSISSNKRDKF